MVKTTIFHLSDLHYGDDFIPWAIRQRRGWSRRPSKAVVEGLQRLLRDRKPEYVVISGDFVNKAKAQEFTNAADFLRDLLPAAGIDIREQLIVVPGNHDAPFFGREENASVRLKNYLTFTSQLFRDTHVRERREKFIRRDDKNRLIFLALDTTLKTLAPRADGEVGGSQLRWAEEQLQEMRVQLLHDYEDYCKIAVMHHHCVEIPHSVSAANRDMQLLDSGKLLTLLNNFGFNLVLHGHRHVPHASRVLREDEAVLAVVGAGTTLAPYPDQQGTYGNCFNLIEIDHAAAEIKVTNFATREDGSFGEEVSNTFQKGKKPSKGYIIDRLRRVAKININGDTHVIHHRSGIRVAANQRLRTLPIKVFCDSPDAAIQNFTLIKCDFCELRWYEQNPRNHDGKFVFAADRTSQDTPASIQYEYTIQSGTLMKKSAEHDREEFTFTCASDVRDLTVEFEFPRNYLVQVSVLFERNGSPVSSPALLPYHTLQHDPLVNRWTFQAYGTKPDYSITFSWPLPI